MSQGENASIDCSYSNTNFNLILWYKQTSDRKVTLLGYLTGSSPSPESAFKNKTVLKGDANKQQGTLEVLNLARDDVAVYFCAASPHSDTNIFSPEQKHVASYQLIRASVTSFIAQYTCIKHHKALTVCFP